MVDDSLCLKALQNDLTVCIRDEHRCNRRTHGGTISDLNLEGRQRLLVLKVDGQSAFIQPGLDRELIDKELFDLLMGQEQTLSDWIRDVLFF